MSAGRRYLVFLAALGGLTSLLVAVGYLPTRSLAGEAGAAAMLLACGIALVGSAVGAVPIATVRDPKEGLKRITGSMVLRLLVVAVLAGVAYWLLAPERRPFLLWLAISYLVLLVADTRFAQAVLRRL